MMDTFQYRAIDHEGRQDKGRMDALNVADLEARLQRMGLDLITVKRATKSHVFLLGVFIQRMLATDKVGRRDLVLFCFQLEQLLNAGVPMLEALADLTEQTESRAFKAVLAAVLTAVEGGQMFSEALNAHPDTFNKVFVHLIAAGEQSGELPMVLKQLSQTMKWQDELLAQTKRLLSYPAFIVVTVIMAVVFLMVFLVPELVKLVDDLGQTLPWNTRALIFISDVFVDYWWLLGSAPMVLLAVLIVWVKKSAAARYRFDGIKLQLPMIGPVLNKIIMARFSRYFALLYGAGIPVLAALNTCANLAGNQVITQALHEVHDNISAGTSLRDSFEQTGLFPMLVIRMVAVGERSGALDTALMNISYFYDRDVDALLQSLMKILEPMLTVVLGLVLMFVMSAVLGPVYNAFSQMPI